METRTARRFKGSQQVGENSTASIFSAAALRTIAPRFEASTTPSSTATRFASDRIVSGAGSGLYHPILKYEFEHHFADETALDSPEARPTPAELRKFVRRARYALIVRPPADMAEEYGELWESPPALNRDFTLFEVAPDGRLRPVR